MLSRHGAASLRGNRRNEYRILLRSIQQRRCVNSDVHQSPDVRNVAVLGGGITGLATAYYLSKLLPATSRVEIFEAGSRLGGWLKSTSVDVGSGNVVFESGPRSLRPASVSGLVTLDLIAQLGLQDRIITTAKSSPAAQNRYVYYPDHLVRLPGPGPGVFENLRTIWRESVFDGFLAEAMTEVLKPPRPIDMTDESVGSFLSRRFGASAADNLASAVFHGIYAGDIYKLSARTILPSLWRMEAEHSSVMRGMLAQLFGGARPISRADLELLESRSLQLPLAHKTSIDLSKTSVFTFVRGLGELADSLEKALERASNISISRNFLVEKITLKRQHDEHEKICIQSSSLDAQRKSTTNREFSHIISTLPSHVLANCISDPDLSKTLKQTPSVTVMVVNLYYANPNLLPVRGFGYLIPRSLPLEQNPEAALGVIFDTDATPGQDSENGTKVTVMLGGHWWSDWDHFPAEDVGLRMAQNVLERHLEIKDEPTVSNVSLQKDCIPQYVVGHDDRMAAISEDLERLYHGRLRVAGNSYSGVGVNDCVRAARDVVQGLMSGTDRTGLDSFRRGKQWSWAPPQSVKIT